jgi:hypothetical protein
VFGYGNRNAVGDCFTHNTRIVDCEESWGIRRHEEVTANQDLGPRGSIDQPICDGNTFVDDGHLVELIEFASHDPKTVMDAHPNRKVLIEESSSQFRNDPESLSYLLCPDESDDDWSFTNPLPWSRSGGKRVWNIVDRLVDEARVGQMRTGIFGRWWLSQWWIHPHVFRRS